MNPHAERLRSLTSSTFQHTNQSKHRIKLNSRPHRVSYRGSIPSDC